MKTFSKHEFEDLVRLTRALETFVETIDERVGAALADLQWASETLVRAKGLSHRLSKDVFSANEVARRAKGDESNS